MMRYGKIQKIRQNNNNTMTNNNDKNKSMAIKIANTTDEYK